MDTEKKSALPIGGLVKLALVAAGGGGILAADQFGIIDSLLGTDPTPMVAAVAGAVTESPVMSSVMDMARGGVYDGLSWVLHGAVDSVLYPSKLVKDGF